MTVHRYTDGTRRQTLRVEHHMTKTDLISALALDIGQYGLDSWPELFPSDEPSKAFVDERIRRVLGMQGRAAADFWHERCDPAEVDDIGAYAEDLVHRTYPWTRDED